MTYGRLPTGANRVLITGSFYNQERKVVENAARQILFTIDDSLTRKPGHISGGNFSDFNSKLEERFNLKTLQEASEKLEFITKFGYYNSNEVMNAYAVEMKFMQLDFSRTFTLASALYEGSCGWILPPKRWDYFGGPRIFSDLDMNLSGVSIDELASEWSKIAELHPLLKVNISYCENDNPLAVIFVRGGCVTAVYTGIAVKGAHKLHDDYAKREFCGASIQQVKKMVYMKRPDTSDKSTFAAYEHGWTEAEYSAYAERSLSAILNVLRKV